jgi:hypothetical protein
MELAREATALHLGLRGNGAPKRTGPSADLADLVDRLVGPVMDG